MNFRNELKRRRVPRVVLVYVASAFAVIQGADLIVPRLGLPDWLVTAAVVTALIGLPVVIALAWMFDITPDGVQRSEDAAPATRWLSPRTIAVVVIAFAATASMAWYAGHAGARTNIEDATRSIAVLPLVNVGGDSADAHFGDGLAEELLNLLGRVDGLKVAARTSSFAFRDRANDIRMIGDSLGVLTVLEGTVRRDGTRVKVTANLINVADGMRVWTDQYEDDISNIFSVQERLARAIARELELRLGESAMSRQRVNPQAFDLYLRGREQFRDRTTAEHVTAAIELFERAIALDSSYAQAYGAAAMAYSVLPGFDTVSTLVTAPRVHEYARRAIELDDRLPEPHAALCQSLGSAEWKWQEAEEACRAALTRNGSFEWAHVWLGELLAAVGRHDESRAEIDRALLLDPYSPIMYNMAAMSSLMGRDLDRAALMANRLTEFDPANGNLLGSAIDFARGDLAAARRRLDGTGPADQLDYFFAAMRDAQLRDQVGGAIESTVNRNQTNWATRTAGVLSMLGDRERALKYARIAYDRHEFSLAAFASSTMLETLHDDPRFHEILRGMNLDPSILERSRAMRVRPPN